MPELSIRKIIEKHYPAKLESLISTWICMGTGKGRLFH